MWTYQAKLVRVVDGDTVILSVDLGFKVHHEITVRLFGVDTPEKFGVKKGSEEYNKGVESSAFTQQWFDDRDGCCQIKTTKGTGKYGRWLAEIFPADGSDSLNEALLLGGYAKPYSA